jgi:CHAT domain-containing protein
VIAFVIRRDQAEPIVESLGVSPEEVRRFAEAFLNPAPGRLIQQLLSRLGSVVLPAVIEHLIGAQVVYLVPHGALHYLPLHALEHQGECLIDRFPIAYAPSVATVLRVAQPSPADAPVTGDAVLVVGNPTKDLRYARDEAEAVAAHFGAKKLFEEDATFGAVGNALAGKRLLHFAAHASFNVNDPLDSAIRLWGRVHLAGRAVMYHAPKAQLAVLSACETGRHGIGEGDELTGLVSAFLSSGTHALVSSLWRVDDEAARDMMLAFYKRLYDSRGVKQTSAAEALQGAAMTVRKQKPHPYYWAAFSLFGDWQ